jgi:hypothetical protein
MYHFVQVLLVILFGGFAWTVARYIILRAANFFIVNYPAYADTAHTGFMIAFVEWGVLLLILVPCAFYLWGQTQSPEVPQ